MNKIKKRKRLYFGISSNKIWQGQKDLNPRHAVLETAALPTELYPYVFVVSSATYIIISDIKQNVNSFLKKYFFN